MPHFTQSYKYEEIQSYFNDYIAEQDKQWLGDQAFDIINIIKNYEQDNFGKVTTDFSEPEKVVNMYVYIVGEQIVQDYINKQAA